MKRATTLDSIALVGVGQPLLLMFADVVNTGMALDTLYRLEQLFVPFFFHDQELISVAIGVTMTMLTHKLVKIDYANTHILCTKATKQAQNTKHREKFLDWNNYSN